VDVKVTSVDVGGGGCILCESVNEYHRDTGEGVGLEDLARRSYTRRYISLTVESTRDWGML
jgi:hypothetical protein